MFGHIRGLTIAGSKPRLPKPSGGNDKILRPGLLQPFSNAQLWANLAIRRITAIYNIKTMKLVAIGGTGLIGTKVVKGLREKGHEVVAASPSQGINSVTGEGLAEALVGAQVVVDVSNSPSWESTSQARLMKTHSCFRLLANALTGAILFTTTALQQRKPIRLRSRIS